MTIDDYNAKIESATKEAIDTYRNARMKFEKEILQLTDDATKMRLPATLVYAILQNSVQSINDALVKEVGQ